ncbi:Crp/Fnr family transcriptional regulator [Flavobacterium silvaticum]|uniref:Crp/Fnr family transcriptional regulator n=1 Tax=Flavobacterium silvaticum TaxID=1852020 RepID=A0A972FRT0_9FLAO|nr:Crp/Fnr family transcriptional regulator [Flavobacterium silvaticum]NMH28189.1 Crp/Fnr family transcriptional regulator [Flavobacterium silvaticum]
MEEFVAHILKFVLLNNEEIMFLKDMVSEQEFAKKEILLAQNEKADRIFFVSKGCLRLILLSEKGTEITTQFAIENWWLGDMLAFYNETEAVFSVQALEKSKVVTVTKKNLDELVSKIPQLERYFRMCFQKTAGADQRRIRYLFTMSAEERFNNMNTMFPHFIQRVPQYMIASYLGLSAEFLSKIRAGKV